MTTTHPSAVERLAATTSRVADLIYEWMTIGGYDDWSDADSEGLSRFIVQAVRDEAVEAAEAQDIEDGTELRLLREALPKDWEVGVRHGGIYRWPLVEVWDPRYPVGRDDPPQPRYLSSGPTLAAAAKACREALEDAK